MSVITILAILMLVSSVALVGILLWMGRGPSAAERFALLEQIRDGLIQEHDRQKQLDTLRGPDFLKQLERPRRIPTEWAPARHAVDEAPKRVEPMQVTRIRTRTRRVS